MNSEFLLFLLFTFLSVISAFFVISLNNAVHSILFLVFTFFNVACLLILLGAEFFSFLLIIVYVGAIAVLFLFVIMMLNVNINLNFRNFTSVLPVSGLILLFLFNNFQPFYFVDLVRFGLNNNKLILWLNETTSSTNINVIGNHLYTDFNLLFFISGLILLVAMLGAIVLTMHQKDNLKTQRINTQLIRNSKNTVKFLLFR